MPRVSIGAHVTRTIQSSRHKSLTRLIKARRENAGLTQADVATALGRYQSYVANIESGQRRIDVVEFLDLAQAIGFDPVEILWELRSKPPKQRKKTQ